MRRDAGVEPGVSEVVAVIPARSGSKGVPHKNVRLLAGKPLMTYSIRAALLAKNIGRVIVSTDSPEYADLARQHGAEVPFLRPPEISTDTSTDFDFFAHLLEWMKANEGRVPEYFVHLRPTTPFRDPALVSDAVEMLRRVPSATALRSVHEMPESAYKTFEIAGDILKRVGTESTELDVANNARQQFPKTYQANGYVDVVRSALILGQGKLHGGRVQAFVTLPVVEIDTQEDLDYLQFQAEREPALIQKLFQE